MNIDLKQYNLGEYFTRNVNNEIFIQNNNKARKVLNKLLVNYIKQNNIDSI